MADIAIFRINYKSDFILTLQSDAGWATPFCIKFWTGAPSQAYFVGYDGETYTHCAVDGSDPTKLAVQFDDHGLPIGNLKFQIGYHFTVADFPTSVEDEVINQAAVIIDNDGTPMQVMLDFTGETAPEIQFALPAYANEAQRIANEEQREQEFAQMETDFETMQQESEAATSGAENVNAELDGNILTVTDRNGVSKSVNTKGEKGDPGEKVQSDWDSTDTSSPTYIKNKPSIYTKTEVNTLLNGKQNNIDSSHKLSADLVDDTSATNKFVTSTEKSTWNGKQDALVSGTNIKTINNTSVLGGGNISVEPPLYRAADAQTGKLGYKVLKGDASFASQVTAANTIYEIRDVFDLNSGSVTIPAGCTLKFVGGKMSNGTIVGNNTSIEWSGSSIFNTSVLLSGTFNVVLNPRMFGVLANDASVPECLYATHSNAIRIGVPVKYDGIKSLDISVVSNTPVITLSEHTDFCGCVFNIQNNVKDFYLFSLINSNSETAITVSGSDIDSGDFSNVSGFPNEPVLLVVNDETAWLPNRSGESGSVYRKDILLCEKKKSHNSPIFPYNTEDSSPICTFSPVTLSQKYIGNCLMNRTGSKITHFVLAQRIYNLLIENISANTDVEANASIDILIKAQDCAHVKFKDISINGTYSISTAGYAFVLDNVFDFVGERIVAEGNWGVFDANNLNVASLYNSTLNRFDVHYYGRDFLVSGCTDVYVTESSFFGYCKFENCRLENNVVFVSDQGYCAMPFNIIIENCSTKANSFYICKPTFVDTQQHRSDLSDYANSLPSIYVNGFENKNGGAMYLYYEESSSMEPFVAINTPIIDLRGIRSNIRYSITPTLYGKTQPARPYMVDVTASTTFRLVVPQAAQTNIKNIIAGLVIKDCHFDAEKYASAFTELETYDINVNFRDCIINDLRYAGVGKNLFSFDGCYLNLSQNEGGNSYALKAVYRNCTVNTAKQMRINSYNVGVRFENCVNALGDTVIVYGLPSMQNIDLEFATDSFARLLKVNTYADVASLPSYNANIRATAYVSAVNKYVLWNGTAWVNMDGTALS